MENGVPTVMQQDCWPLWNAGSTPGPAQQTKGPVLHSYGVGCNWGLELIAGWRGPDAGGPPQKQKNKQTNKNKDKRHGEGDVNFSNTPSYIR